jgi:putative endonuclease
MLFTFYILYSATLNKYYVGFTGDDLQQRLRRHNSNHKGFTGRTADWKIVYTDSYTNEAECRKRELEVKKWKSRKLIGELIASGS